jgi:hypothetical protein
MTLEAALVGLRERAIRVLRANDAGRWTQAARGLYPHQWSWDAAIIAIGLCHVDARRAMLELDSLFAAQWSNGKVPHIVFDPLAEPGTYFPDAERWGCSEAAEAPRAPVRTSGLCQPPVHALAVHRLWQVHGPPGAPSSPKVRAFVRRMFPRLLRWHRYLAGARDPEGSGLVTIYHPWESGADNSPRWDDAMAAIAVGDLPPYERSDLRHVGDASQRPTSAHYDRYLWLVEALKGAGYREADVYRGHPFLVKDVFFSAILTAADACMLEMGEVAEASDEQLEELRERAARGRRAQEGAWDDALRLSLDRDARTGAPVRTRTFAGFSPLLAGVGARCGALLEELDSARFAGALGLRWRLCPTTSPGDAAFERSNYWRGPVWPVVNWFLWWGLRRAGALERAAEWRAECLDQMAACGFAEYLDPFTGAPLGAGQQSWSAAVTLDWLAEGAGP